MKRLHRIFTNASFVGAVALMGALTGEATGLARPLTDGHFEKAGLTLLAARETAVYEKETEEERAEPFPEERYVRLPRPKLEQYQFRPPFPADYPAHVRGGYPPEYRGGYPPEYRGGYPPEYRGGTPPEVRGSYPGGFKGSDRREPSPRPPRY